MECFIRSTKNLITQRRGRSGWRPSRAHSQASGRVLPILTNYSRFFDDRRVQYSTLRAKRLGRKGDDWITGARPHRNNITERTICQAGRPDRAFRHFPTSSRQWTRTAHPGKDAPCQNSYVCGDGASDAAASLGASSVGGFGQALRTVPDECSVSMTSGAAGRLDIGREVIARAKTWRN
jgi:hypothetical protein